VPESLLQILTFCLLLIVWLFLIRVIWAVWAEAKAPLTLAPGAPAQAQGGPGAAAPPGRSTAASAPAATAAAKLKVVEPPEHRGQTFDLGQSGGELKIGRAATNQIALGDDSYVSQLHARVFRRDGALYVEDLGSTNGTFLNRKKLGAPVALHRGDRIQVGRTVLEVSK
jgi:hypothetical protein